MTPATRVLSEWLRDVDLGRPVTTPAGLRAWLRRRRERAALAMRWGVGTKRMQDEIAVDRLLAELEGRQQLDRYEPPNKETSNG